MVNDAIKLGILILGVCLSGLLLAFGSGLLSLIPAAIAGAILLLPDWNNSQRGKGLDEYLLILSLIAIVAIVAFLFLTATPVKK